MEGKLQEDATDDKSKHKTFKWKVKGRVVSRGLSQSGVQECTHPTLMKDMCAECGADLRENPGHAGSRKEAVSASVAMVHSIPELIVSEEEALEIGKADEDRLLRTRKLGLLVDLDQTLIHTTNDNIPANLKGVYHFQLAHGNSILWYHTRLRPNTEEFLQKISEMYELHICTFGVRLYAHTIANFLDPEGKYFSHRILSRDECFSFDSKVPNLKALFPCGDSMVCIIDDREDVWSFSPNLIHVKPYRFFQGTADINAPPGCQKTESDTDPVKHRVRRISHTSDGHSQVEEIDTKTGNAGEGNQKAKIESESKENVSEKLPDSESVKAGNPDIVNDLKTVDKTKETNELTEEEKTDEVFREGDGLDSECVCNTEVISVLDSASEKDADKLESESGTKDAKLSSTKGTDGSEIDTDNEKADEGGESETKDAELSSCKESDVETVSEEIEWVDDDDYLLHLEEILRRVHKAFFDVYDQMAEKGHNVKVPDMKSIIPYVKKKVLKGTNVLFSGVFPTNMPLEKSRAFKVAKSLGANIHTSFIGKSSQAEDSGNHTTHVIAARLGTTKVRAAQKSYSAFIVTPEWLWTCGDRWDHVDERLFPLTEETQAALPAKAMEQVEPPKQPHSFGGGKRKNATPVEEVVVYDRVTGKKIQPKKQRVTPVDEVSQSDAAGCLTEQDKPIDSTVSGEQQEERKSGSFAKSYNPLYSFSDEEIATMDREVEELMEDEEGSEDDEDTRRKHQDLRRIVLGKSLSHDSSSEEDSLSGDFPRGWQIKKKLKKLGKFSHSGERMAAGDMDNEAPVDTDEEEEMQVEESEDEADNKRDDESEKSDDSIGSVDDIIALAVEKEFLS